MVLDNRTILFLSIAIIGVITLLLPFSRSFSGNRNDRMWEASNIALLMGLLLISAQGLVPPWISILLGNAAIISSFILIAAAITHAADRVFCWKLFLALFVLVVSLIAWFTYIRPDTWLRVQIMSAASVTVCVYTVLKLLNAYRRSHEKGVLSLSAAFIVLGIASLVRMLLMSRGITSVLEGDLSTAIMFISTVVAFLTWNFGMFDHHVRAYALERDEKLILLENRNKELDFLYHIHDKLAGNLDIPELIDSALLMLRRTLGTEAVGMCLFDTETGKIRLETSYGLPTKFADKVREMVPGQEASGRAYQTGQSIFVDLCAPHASELHQVMAEAGYCQHASIPLRSGGRILGVLNVAKKAAAPFLDREVRMLESAAAILGSALNTAEHYSNAVLALEQRKMYENELETFFNTSMDMLCIMELDGRFRKLSSRWTQVLGWTEQELLDMAIDKRVLPEDVEATREEVQKLARGGSIVGFINRYVAWDGTIRWFEWNAYGNAELGMIIAAARDITERKQNEAALLAASNTIEQKNADLTQVMEQLKHAAITDSLTGLYNRRYIMERIHEQTHRYHREGEPFSFIIGDIDRFKLFNDTHGHDYGDFVLIKVAETLQTGCRESDVLCRWGGEEFLILLPGADLSEACAIAERMREQLEQSTFEYRDIASRVTMTFGVEEFHQELGVDACIQRADQMLLQGKSRGRNRVECGYHPDK